jgi:hypothetical protein
MGLDSKAGSQRISGSIGGHFRPIEIEFFAPDESCLLAQLHNLFKETAKDLDPRAFTDACQTGMVGERLVQIIPEVPSDAESISGMAHQEAFGTYPLEEHHELQFEEHDGVNRGATCASTGLLDKFAHKRKVKRSLQVAIKVIRWHELFN